MMMEVGKGGLDNKLVRIEVRFEVNSVKYPLYDIFVVLFCFD